MKLIKNRFLKYVPNKTFQVVPFLALFIQSFINIKSKIKFIKESSWCNGYHIGLWVQRFRVQSRAGANSSFYFFFAQHCSREHGKKEIQCCRKNKTVKTFSLYRLQKTEIELLQRLEQTENINLHVLVFTCNAI